MLKIHKGLKKKKKDKKNKSKEDDLFDKEELEKYRKEHQNQSVSSTANESDLKNNCLNEQSDEWKKFNVLTAGIDNILQKTQEDLSRIKSTSFFQRKAPTLPTETEIHTSSENKEEKPTEEPEIVENYTEFDDSLEEEFEVDDSIFNTSYVDAVATGKLKLAYIPDSPIKEDNYDPFDTSIADRFIQINPKKRYLNLGSAVEVLSGQSNKIDLSTNFDICAKSNRKQLRRRIPPNNLLLSSFDENNFNEYNITIDKNICKEKIIDTPAKTLLDDDPVFIESKINTFPLTATDIKIAIKEESLTKSVTSDTEKINFSDFENINYKISDTVAVEKQSYNKESDEFFELAAESVAKQLSNTAIDIKSDKSIVFQPNNIKNFSFDELSENKENTELDPFDTSIVNKVLETEKLDLSLENISFLKYNNFISQSEKDIQVSSDLTEPSKNLNFKGLIEENNLFLNQSNKLDSENFVQSLTPLKLSNKAHQVDKDFDPFDTSHISGTPGKIELKLIEKELVGHSNLNDNEFDPRQFETNNLEKTVSLTDTILGKYISISKQENNQKVSQSESIDILTGDQEQNQQEIVNQLFKPVKPEKFINDSENFSYTDPFDTSIANNIQPGKTELRILETELITNQ